MLYFIILTIVLAYGGDPLEELETIECYGGSLGDPGYVELTVKEARVSVAGLVNFSTRAYHYRRSGSEDLVPMVPGPTIKMMQGHECRLLLKNELPPKGGQNCIAKYYRNLTMKQGYHCSDTTNMHTHGLWISPTVDDIAISVRPGESHWYNYSVRYEHMPGTFWYHAHHHGSTFIAVYGGQFGALIVEPIVSYALYFRGDLDLTSLYNQSSVLVMFHAFFGGDDAQNGYADVSEPFWAADYVEIANNYSNVTVDPDVEFEDETLRDFYVVNNQYQPVVTISANQPSLLRIIHASGVRILSLVVDADERTNKTCEMKLIARDGIFQYTPYQTINSIILIQGTRADVAFKCPTGTYNVRSRPQWEACNLIGLAHQYVQETIFTLKVKVTLDPESDFPTTEAYFPWYLHNYCENASLTEPWGYYEMKTFNFTPHNLNDGFDQIGGVMGKIFPGFAYRLLNRSKIENTPWDSQENPWAERLCLNEQYMFNFYDNTERNFRPDPHCATSEFDNFTANLESATRNNKTCLADSGSAGQHPYHQHQNPFQIVWYDTGPGVTDYVDAVRLCEWRDTIPTSPNINIQFTPRAFVGDVIVHCHLLQHEDNGMMGFFHFTDDLQYCKGALPTYNCRSPEKLCIDENLTGTSTERDTWFWLTIALFIILLAGAPTIWLLARKRKSNNFSDSPLQESKPVANNVEVTELNPLSDSQN